LGSGCFGEVESTAIGDGLLFDLASHGEDALATPEVDIGRRQIVQALVIAAVIVVLDKGGSVSSAVSKPGCGGSIQNHSPAGPKPSRIDRIPRAFFARLNSFEWVIP
jgi:hypothetical protein